MITLKKKHSLPQDFDEKALAISSMLSKMQKRRGFAFRLLPMQIANIVPEK